MKTNLLIAMLAICLVGCKNVADESSIENTTEIAADSMLVVKSDEIISATPETPLEVKGTQPEQVEIAVAKTETATAKVNYATFGKKITADNVLTPAQMLAKYKGLKSGDTISVKFKSAIKEVCKKKGCWMSMAMPGQEAFVRFKDYGFFVPLNADGSEAIVGGRAYLDVISVAQLQHYAKDGGKSQEEIDKITQPKVTYAFQADGVLIQE